MDSLSSRGCGSPRHPGENGERENDGAEKVEGEREGWGRERVAGKETERDEKEETGLESFGVDDEERGRERIRERGSGSCSGKTPPAASDLRSGDVTPVGDARTSDPSIGDCGGQDNGQQKDKNRRLRRHAPLKHRVIRGGVKASFVGPNVEALPVWGALDAIAGSALLVDCRTPAQWRAEDYRPTAQVGLCGIARFDFSSLFATT